MTRAEIRTFLQSGVTAVDSNMPFGSGRISEWNSNRSNEYPGVWWESIEEVSVDLINSNLPNDSWPIKLHIAKKDAQDSSAEQYEQIIDDCDYIAQQLIYKLNQALSGSDFVTLESISRMPFVKKNADVVTGVVLSFNLKVEDKTVVCS